jgi:hypothetical protein
MSTRKIRASKGRIAALYNLLTTTVPQESDIHLRDEDFAGYAAEMLDDIDMSRVDSHLAYCSQCAADMEHLMTAADTWQQLNVREHLAAIRAAARVATEAKSPKHLISSAVSTALAIQVGDTIRQLLVSWNSWITSLSSEALQIRTWQPISVSGFLSPRHASEPDAAMKRSVGSRLPSSRTFDLVLKTPTELVALEIPQGPPVAVHVTIKGTTHDFPVLVLLMDDCGGISIGEAQADAEMPIHTVQFTEVNPGHYFVAFSPEVDNEKKRRF